MIAKRINKWIGTFFSLVLICLCIPITSLAAESETIYGVMDRAAGSGCHCGGIRMERIYERQNITECNLHGGSCTNNKAIYERTYYYCTNPHCTDTYYSEWVYVETIHL
jgi:hypothetical protein